jgi:hypothetical protein
VKTNKDKNYLGFFEKISKRWKYIPQLVWPRRWGLHPQKHYEVPWQSRDKTEENQQKRREKKKRLKRLVKGKKGSCKLVGTCVPKAAAHACEISLTKLARNQWKHQRNTQCSTIINLLLSVVAWLIQSPWMQDHIDKCRISS